MQITIVGAGPAGLYAAILVKSRRPDVQVRGYEQNPAGATCGCGVVFSDQALEFLRADDEETADLIEPHMRRWSDIAVVHRGVRIAIDGIGFAAIGRLELLHLLTQRAAGLGHPDQLVQAGQRRVSLGEHAGADHGGEAIVGIIESCAQVHVPKLDINILAGGALAGLARSSPLPSIHNIAGAILRPSHVVPIPRPL